MSFGKEIKGKDKDIKQCGKKFCGSGQFCSNNADNWRKQLQASAVGL